MKRNKHTAAFTLVEILVTTAIAAVISLALFTAFSNGIRIWRRVNTRVAAEQFALFCERFRDDTLRAVNFSTIPCAGRETGLEFACLVAVPGQPLRGVGRVEYAFENGGITRAAGDYPSAFAFQRPEGRTVLEGVRVCAFEYYFFDSVKKEYGWAEEWQQPRLPLAVRLRCEFKDGREAVRTFTFPTGGHRP